MKERLSIELRIRHQTKARMFVQPLLTLRISFLEIANRIDFRQLKSDLLRLALCLDYRRQTVSGSIDQSHVGKAGKRHWRQVAPWIRAQGVGFPIDLVEMPPQPNVLIQFCRIYRFPILNLDAHNGHAFFVNEPEIWNDPTLPRLTIIPVIGPSWLAFPVFSGFCIGPILPIPLQSLNRFAKPDSLRPRVIALQHIDRAIVDGALLVHSKSPEQPNRNRTVRLYINKLGPD